MLDKIDFILAETKIFVTIFPTSIEIILMHNLSAKSSAYRLMLFLESSYFEISYLSEIV